MTISNLETIQETFHLLKIVRCVDHNFCFNNHLQDTYYAYWRSHLGNMPRENIKKSSILVNTAALNDVV